MDTLLILTNLPDREQALALAKGLVEEKLAACVNVLGACASVYAWKGAVESAEEVPLLIKTVRMRYAEVESFIRKNHPYELPEIVAVPIAQGFPEYLNWIAAETAEKK